MSRAVIPGFPCKGNRALFRLVLGMILPEVLNVQLCFAAAAAAKLLQSCLTLCDPVDSSPTGTPSLGFSRQEHWSGLPFPSPMQESENEVTQCRTLRDPVDCSLPGFSVQGIFQARVLEWGTIALSASSALFLPNLQSLYCSLPGNSGSHPIHSISLRPQSARVSF